MFFRGVIFATRKNKNIFKKNVQTDQPYLEDPSACKTGFLFFVVLYSQENALSFLCV